MKYFLFSVAALSLCIAVPVAAQKQVPIKTYRANPVVVTGTGTHARLSEAPIPVTVLTGEDLAKTGSTSLEGALLKLVPSFSSTPLGSMGSTMTMNGLEEGYILFLVNGQRMIGSGTGAPDLTRVDPANIRRIEILDGAASTLYGSDAIAGVVNIITEDWSKGVELSSQSSVRSHGRYEQSVNLDAREGRMGTYTSFIHQKANGWQLNPMEEDKTGTLVPSTKLASFGFRSDNVSQRLTYDFDKRWSAWAEGSYYDYKQNRPLTIGDQNTTYNYNMLHYNHAWGAGVDYTVSKRLALSAEYRSDSYISKYAYIRASGAFKVGDEETRVATGFRQARVKGVFNIGQVHKLSAGAEYLEDRLDDYKSATLPGAVSNATFSVFAQDELRIHRNWKAILAGRYLNHEKLGSHATPSVALMYTTGGFRVRASLANGYKTPNLADIHTHYISNAGELTIGNENLRPEKSTYASLGVEYSMENLIFSATGFVNKLRDKVEVVSFDVSNEQLADYQQLYGTGVTGNLVKKRSNIDRAEISGVTLRAKACLGLGFVVQAGYNYIDALNTSGDKNERLDKSVPHSGNFGAQWSNSWGRYKLSIDLNGQLRAARYSSTYSPRIGDAPAYSLWDLHTTHTFDLGKTILSPSVGVENILNYRDDRPGYKYYVNASGKGATTMSPYSTLSPGRTLYVSLKIRFKDR